MKLTYEDKVEMYRLWKEDHYRGYLKVSKAENADGMYGDAAARTFTKAHTTA